MQTRDFLHHTFKFIYFKVINKQDKIKYLSSLIHLSSKQTFHAMQKMKIRYLINDR
jgi:hypothetical protein